ncbi:hypothetical protein JTB14_035815 [Gonioctena quinquepunctata]|nr:hypothetical protein JTB14_035815 [Gonioctena quinquepunctata]
MGGFGSICVPPWYWGLPEIGMVRGAASMMVVVMLSRDPLTSVFVTSWASSVNSVQLAMWSFHFFITSIRGLLIEQPIDKGKWPGKRNLSSTVHKNFNASSGKAVFCFHRVSNRLLFIALAAHTKRGRIPLEEVSDNNYEFEEDASEPSDYEEQSDTDDEDTEKVSSEIGEQ